MKKKFFPVILLLCVPSAVSGQQLDSLVRECLTLHETDRKREFELAYPKLYDQYLKDNYPSYIQAVEATETDPDKAFPLLESLVEEDLFLDGLEYDTNFTALHGTEGWVLLLEKIRKIKASYNDDLRRELKHIQDRDQGIRILYLNIPGDSLKKIIHGVMKTVDRESAESICGILDKHGWPGPGEVGEEGNETVFLAIQHVDDPEIQQKYLPMLREAFEDGRAEGWHLAFLTDRILMNRGEKQIYGTQKIITGEGYYIVPLADPERVDELRAELGMAPLAEDMEEEGYDWNLEDYLRDLPRIETMYGERNQSLE